MVEILDFQTIKTHSSDSRELRTLLRQLLGQPFLFFRVSYGEELTIHLGELIDYSRPRMKQLRKGSYVLSARASSWYFRPKTEPLMFVGTNDNDLDPTTLAHRVDVHDFVKQSLVESGSIVGRVEIMSVPGGFSLSLVFSDGSMLLIIPSIAISSEAPIESDEIADWELFTPYGRFLRVGPGPDWAYLASDQPRLN